MSENENSNNDITSDIEPTNNDDESREAVSEPSAIEPVEAIPVGEEPDNIGSTSDEDVVGQTISNDAHESVGDSSSKRKTFKFMNRDIKPWQAHGAAFALIFLLADIVLFRLIFVLATLFSILGLIIPKYRKYMTSSHHRWPWLIAMPVILFLTHHNLYSSQSDRSYSTAAISDSENDEKEEKESAEEKEARLEREREEEERIAEEQRKQREREREEKRAEQEAQREREEAAREEKRIADIMNLPLSDNFKRLILASHEYYEIISEAENEKWAFYPPNTRDCDGDRYDVAPGDDAFERRENEKERKSIRKESIGKIMIMRDSGNLANTLKVGEFKVERSDYDFRRKRYPFTISVNSIGSKWPIPGPNPRITSDSYEVSRRETIGRVGRQKVQVRRTSTVEDFDNNSSMTLHWPIDEDTASSLKSSARGEVILLFRFDGFGLHRRCRTSCIPIVGCMEMDIGFGEYIRATLLGAAIIHSGEQEKPLENLTQAGRRMANTLPKLAN